MGGWGAWVGGWGGWGGWVGGVFLLPVARKDGLGIVSSPPQTLVVRFICRERFPQQQLMVPLGFIEG